MTIRYEEQFKNALYAISSYISKDKPSASHNFKKDLKSKIEDENNLISILDIFKWVEK